MTKDQFLAKLTYYPFDWYLDDHGQIRAKDEKGNCLCPVQGVVFKETGRIMIAWETVMPKKLLRAIILAADNEKGHDPALRRQLLEACGLDRVEE